MIITDPVGSCSESFPVQELFDPSRSFPVHAINVGSDMAEGPFQATSGTSALILLRCIIQKHLWHVGLRITEISAFDATIEENGIQALSSTRTQEHHLSKEKDAMLRHSLMKSKTASTRNAMVVYFTRMHQTLYALTFAHSTSCSLQVEGWGRSGFTLLFTVAQKIKLPFPFFLSLMQKPV